MITFLYNIISMTVKSHTNWNCGFCVEQLITCGLMQIKIERIRFSECTFSLIKFPFDGNQYTLSWTHSIHIQIYLAYHSELYSKHHTIHQNKMISDRYQTWIFRQIYYKIIAHMPYAWNSEQKKNQQSNNKSFIWFITNHYIM